MAPLKLPSLKQQKVSLILSSCDWKRSVTLGDLWFWIVSLTINPQHSHFKCSRSHSAQMLSLSVRVEWVSQRHNCAMVWQHKCIDFVNWWALPTSCTTERQTDQSVVSTCTTSTCCRLWRKELKRQSVRLLVWKLNCAKCRCIAVVLQSSIQTWEIRQFFPWPPLPVSSF